MSMLCRACGAGNLLLVRPSSLPPQLRSSDFAITDDGYGITGDIYRCPQCDFMQCSDMPDVLNFYAKLEDPGYEEGRDQRLLQARALLAEVAKACELRTGRTRLLDVGAGSGILVQAAQEKGLLAEGVEPSAWLSKAARQHGARVHTGIFPHPDATGPYDIITLIDVIEHVTDPAAILRAVRAELAPGGIVVIATPDASSFAARIMGWRWWHYRIAHIGYFDPDNLMRLCAREGFQRKALTRPWWYFTLSYLRQRLLQYLPWWLLPGGRWMDKVVVPVNLFDSILLICARSDASSRGGVGAG